METIVKDLTLLRAKMRYGIAHFTYLKADGTLREAFGTLSQALIPADKLPHQQRERRPDVFTYYDLERMAWRSFITSRLLEILEGMKE